MGDVPSSRLVLYFPEGDITIANLSEIHNKILKFMCKVDKS